MKHRLLNNLLSPVRRNCLISDSRHWGDYSICGLLLRLRELYRFEKNLSYSEGIEHRDLAGWIGETEKLWGEMAGKEFLPLSVRGKEFDPFDSEGVNSYLQEHGLIYGAGYGIHMKPIFFLADLEEKKHFLGCTIYVAGKEYARDLSLHPAMLQNKTIYARREITEILLWERFEDVKAMKSKGALYRAFETYNMETRPDKQKIKAAASAELLTYVHHELGEAHESDVLGPSWKEMLSETIGNKAALFLRGVKDVLADTSDRGMFKHIIAERKEGSLYFYLVFLSGYRRLISSNLHEAVSGFRERRSWEEIERARLQCYEKTKDLAIRLMETYKANGKTFEAEIEKQITLTCPSRPR